MTNGKHDTGPVQIWILKHDQTVPRDLSVKGDTCYANQYSTPEIAKQSAPYRGKGYESALARLNRTRTRTNRK